MRQFNVKVNGKSYSVEVEELGASASVAAAPVAAAPAPAAKPVAAAPVAAAPAPAAGNGEPVPAPMPGLVKKLCFANGTAVKKGDTIIILEAMKMDTPVVANKDGVISYTTTAGTNVDTGATIATIA